MTYKCVNAFKDGTGRHHRYGQKITSYEYNHLTYSERGNYRVEEDEDDRPRFEPNSYQQDSPSPMFTPDPVPNYDTPDSPKNDFEFGGGTGGGGGATSSWESSSSDSSSNDSSSSYDSGSSYDSSSSDSGGGSSD